MIHWAILMILLLVTLNAGSLKSWEFEVVDSAIYVGKPILVLDGEEDPHIAYSYRAGTHSYDSMVRYAYRTSGHWSYDVVDSSCYPGGFALDGTDSPHISYIDYTYPFQRLWYASMQDDTWQAEIVDSTHGALNSSLAVDSQNLPLLSYYSDPGPYNLRYARFNGTSWVTDFVAGGEAGWTNSIQVDSEDMPHIAFSDFVYPGQYVLEYGVSERFGDWDLEVVDDDGPHLGYHCSLALDENDIPHISYMEARESFEANHLKYARKVGFLDWDVATVDSVDDVGWHTSIAIDPMGHPGITYSGNYQLRYASWDGETWNIEVVADIRSRYTRSSISFNSGGRPMIAFSKPDTSFSFDTHYLILAVGESAASVDENDHSVIIPRSLSLAQNYPNPFNPSTTIRYEIPSKDGSVPVRLLIYDLRGRLIRTLVDEDREPGSYQVHWDGRDSNGQSVISGVYLYRIETGDFTTTRKLVVVR